MGARHLVRGSYVVSTSCQPTNGPAEGDRTTLSGSPVGRYWVAADRHADRSTRATIQIRLRATPPSLTFRVRIRLTRAPENRHPGGLESILYGNLRRLRILAMRAELGGVVDPSARVRRGVTMSQSISRRKRFTITAVVAALLLAAGGGAAYAYWTTSGSGTGAASTGTSTAFTVTSSAPTGGPLTPGGSAETIAFTVANPGTGSAKLTAVAVSVASADGTAWTAVTGCSALDYSVGTPTITYGEVAGGSNLSGTVTITMNDLATSQDACKNVSVPLYFTAS